MVAVNSVDSIRVQQNIFRDATLPQFGLVNIGLSPNSIVRNNLFLRSANTCVSAAITSRVENNTFVDCDRAVYKGGYAPLEFCQNNIFYRCRVAISGPCEPVPDFNLFFENVHNWTNGYGDTLLGSFSVFANPEFVDADNDDFRLSVSSPCIDAGNPDPQYKDPDGSRNDIGAYPYGTPTAVNSDDLQLLPTIYSLYQNYPNPFNPTTTISFDLPVKSHVELVVYNILGQRVATVVDQDFPAGEHEAKWYGTNDQGVSVASGVYLYRIRAEGFVQTRKMLLLK
jgi:hypothetical protein